jgi:hypothetical protein
MTIAIAMSGAVGYAALITVSESLMLSVNPARHRISPSARYHTGSFKVKHRVVCDLRDADRSPLII